MYGFEQLQWQQLIGERLESVVFAENVIALAFSSRKSVSVSNRVSFRLGLSGPETAVSPPSERSPLVELVGRRVKDATVKSRARLTLRFEYDGFIKLFDDSSAYECVILDTDEGTYVV